MQINILEKTGKQARYAGIPIAAALHATYPGVRYHARLQRRSIPGNGCQEYTLPNHTDLELVIINDASTDQDVIDTNVKLATIKVPTDPVDTRAFSCFNVCFCHSTLMMRAEEARRFEYR